MTSASQCKKLAEDFYAAIQARKFDEAASILDPNCQVIANGSLCYKSRDEIMGYFKTALADPTAVMRIASYAPVDGDNKVRCIIEQKNEKSVLIKIIHQITYTYINKNYTSNNIHIH